MPSLRRRASSTFLVRATTSILSAVGTAEIQILRPFRRQPLPWASAKVRSSRLLLPESGSVSAMQHWMSPPISGGSRSRRIACVP